MEEIAQVYARSLFEVAKEHGKLDSVKSQLGQFADALEQNRDLAVFFFSPYFSTEEKQEGLERVGRGSRAGAGEVPRAADREAPDAVHLSHPAPVRVLWDHENRRLPVEVTTAVALDPR